MKLGCAPFVSFLVSLFIAHKKYYCLENLFTFLGTNWNKELISKHICSNKLSYTDKTKKKISVTATSLNITPFVFV